MAKEAPAVIVSEEGEAGADSAFEAVEGAGGLLAQVTLELAEGLLDGV